MAQTCYFQAQFLIISYNTLIITISSECIYHFSSKMAHPETLKMVVITTQTCPRYVGSPQFISGGAPCHGDNRSIYSAPLVLMH
jgi:hypothetical protein